MAVNILNKVYQLLVYRNLYAKFCVSSFSNSRDLDVQTDGHGSILYSTDSEQEYMCFERSATPYSTHNTHLYKLSMSLFDNSSCLKVRIADISI